MQLTDKAPYSAYIFRKTMQKAFCGRVTNMAASPALRLNKPPEQTKSNPPGEKEIPPGNGQIAAPTL